MLCYVNAMLMFCSNIVIMDFGVGKLVAGGTTALFRHTIVTLEKDMVTHYREYVRLEGLVKEINARGRGSQDYRLRALNNDFDWVTTKFCNIAMRVADHVRMNIKNRSWMKKRYLKCRVQKDLASMLKDLKKGLAEVTKSLQWFGITLPLLLDAHMPPGNLEKYAEKMEQRKFFLDSKLYGK